MHPGNRTCRVVVLYENCRDIDKTVIPIRIPWNFSKALKVGLQDERYCELFKLFRLSVRPFRYGRHRSSVEEERLKKAYRHPTNWSRKQSN